MKILVVSSLYPPDTVGGYELGCRQAVDALRDRGHDVRVLTTAPRTPCETPGHVLRRLRLTDMWDSYSDGLSTEVALRMKETEAFQLDAFNAHTLLATLDEFQPDVVYVWMLVGIGGLGLMGCLHHLCVPWVWHLMDEVPSRLCTLFYKVQPELAREFARQLRGSYLSCSQQLLDDIERTGIKLGGEISVFPNWVTGRRPSPRAGHERNGVLRIVAAATLIDRMYDKGIDLLIDAASQLVNLGFEGFSLDIYGKVTDSHFAEMIRTRHLAGRVQLKGMLDQAKLVEAFQEYDLFAFPGRTAEPFGFAPLEAMSRGCVPVINRKSGVAEWLVHGVHCVKVARDAESFAGAFRQFLTGELTLGPMAVRGENAVWRDFHIDAMMPRIEAALTRQASRGRIGAGTADEAYQMVVLASKLANIFIQEACPV